MSQKIRVEKIERIFLSKTLKKHCVQCQGEQIFVSAENAASYFGLTAREIYQLAEANQIHFYELKNGQMYVCLGSRKKILGEKNR